MNDEVITPEVDLTKLFGEMKYLWEKTTFEADQNFVGLYSHLLYFFQSNAVAFSFCLRLNNHFITLESVILFESIIEELAKSTRDRDIYVGPTSGVILLNEEMVKVYKRRREICRTNIRSYLIE